MVNAERERKMSFMFPADEVDEKGGVNGWYQKEKKQFRTGFQYVQRLGPPILLYIS